MSGVIPPFPIFLHGVYRDFKDFTFTPYKPGSGLDVEALQYRHFNTVYKFSKMTLNGAQFLILQRRLLSTEIKLKSRLLMIEPPHGSKPEGSGRR